MADYFHSISFILFLVGTFVHRKPLPDDKPKPQLEIQVKCNEIHAFHCIHCISTRHFRWNAHIPLHVNLQFRWNALNSQISDEMRENERPLPKVEILLFVSFISPISIALIYSSICHNMKELGYKFARSNISFLLPFSFGLLFN